MQKIKSSKLHSLRAVPLLTLTMQPSQLLIAIGMALLLQPVAAFNFSSVFGSHMVLQRDVKAAVYGGGGTAGRSSFSIIFLPPPPRTQHNIAIYPCDAYYPTLQL